jgi:hypothetical protein
LKVISAAVVEMFAEVVEQAEEIELLTNVNFFHVPLKMIPELHAPAPFVFFLTAYTDRFHIPVVSNALLLEEPSMYSENNKSEASTPAEAVVVFAVLLEAETFPAASFALR